jgi:hypothetical protein
MICFTCIHSPSSTATITGEAVPHAPGSWVHPAESCAVSQYDSAPPVKPQQSTAAFFASSFTAYLSARYVKCQVTAGVGILMVMMMRLQQGIFLQRNFKEPDYNDKGASIQ